MANNLRPGQMLESNRKRIESLLGVENEETAVEIEVSSIEPFPNHPFHVEDDEEMEELVASIREKGILTPVLVRPNGPGCYQMISGHRRLHAATRLGIEKIPAIIRDVDDDDAAILMVDSNIQRKLRPSEKAFAFRMKLDAIRHQGERKQNEKDEVESDGSVSQTDTEETENKATSRDIIATQMGIGTTQLSRYIRLTELIPQLLEMVDDRKLSILTGVNVSFLPEPIQTILYDVLCKKGNVSDGQIAQLRKYQDKGKLNEIRALEILEQEKVAKPRTRKVMIHEKKLNQYFPKSYSEKQMIEIIEALLQKWVDGKITVITKSDRDPKPDSQKGADSHE